MYQKFKASSGFTLVEIMIVISIIIFLASFAIFPYSYYMKRSYVERTRDALWQEWIIAHKEVRNGKLFDVEKHAHIVLLFERSGKWVDEYLLYWNLVPPISEFTKSTTNSNIKFERFLPFDSGIELLDFRWFSWSESEDKFWYIIRPPYWSWSFFTGSTWLTFSLTGILLTIGYNGANINNGHARDMLLRPYLQ